MVYDFCYLDGIQASNIEKIVCENNFLMKYLRDEKKFVYVQGQIVVRGRERFALVALFKLDIYAPHMRT